jgi:hypothetical protein
MPFQTSVVFAVAGAFGGELDLKLQLIAGRSRDLLN